MEPPNSAHAGRGEFEAIARLARALTAARLGAYGLSVFAPLVMELGVTPALWLWQRRVARAFLSPPE